MNKTLTILMPILFIVAVFGVLAYQQYVELQNITADLSSVSLDAVSLSGATARLAVNITNPSYVPLDVSNLHLDINGAGHLLGKIDSGQFELPARGTISKDFSFSIKFADLGFSVLSALRTREIDWSVDGTANVLLPLGYIYQYKFHLPQNETV